MILFQEFLLQILFVTTNLIFLSSVVFYVFNNAGWKHSDFILKTME